MARKNRRVGPGSPANQALRKAEKDQREHRRRRARAVRIVAVAALVVVLGGAALFTVNARADRTGDLSVVGAGVPVVVQVNDPTCPICTQLLSNVRRVDGRFDDEELLIRVADVSTDDGLAFAARYTQQRRVTLLFFDAGGRLVDVQSGLQTPEELEARFAAHAGRR